MITIKIDGIEAVKEKLKGFSDRRFNAAMATALTRTAVATHAAARAALDSSIERPTPYTRRALKYVPAKADNLAAMVGFDIERITDMDGRSNVRYVQTLAGELPSSRYLQYQVSGGTRKLKRFELALQANRAMPKGWVAVPGAGARLDAYGNMSRGQIAQIIAQLGTELLSGYLNTPKSVRAKISGQRRAGGQFIAVLPGSKSKLKPGIYQRELVGSNLTPVLMFMRKAQYQPRYDFDGVVRRTASALLPAEVQRAIAEQAARLRARGG